MAFLALFIRKAPFALLILLLWLVAPTQGVQAATGGPHKPPAATCTIHPPDGWRPYRIQPGETLAAFAQRHGVTEEQLRQVNCLPTATVRPNFLLLAPSNNITATSTVTATVVLTLTLPVTPTAALSPTVTPPVTPTVPPAPTSTPTNAPPGSSTPATTSAMTPTAPLTPTLTTAVTPTVPPAPTATPSVAATPTLTLTSALTVTSPVASMPTITPTVTPKPLPPMATATRNMTPTLTTAPTVTPTLSITPTAAVQTDANGQAKPPTAARALAINPVQTVGDVAANFAGQLWFMVALLLVMIALTGYFSLGEAVPAPVAANHGIVSFIGYTLFILAGFLVGLFATSLFQPTSPFSLPAFSGGIGTVLLIGLLTLKEVTSPWTGQAKTLRRLMSMALVPLLAIFLIAVVSKLAGFLR